MPSKVQLDKQAWQWVDSTLPHDISAEHIATAYRLNLPRCKQGACKRNCRGNPFCINGLGEKQFFAKVEEDNDFDPEEEIREDDCFVGLKNLGATCYVNTFLQLWFHNHAVRNAIYRWREPGAPPKLTNSEWMPHSICGHLQLIFALLQFSKRCYVDPSPFINHLGLDAAQQQDAQEFSKLFLSQLEYNLTSESGDSAPFPNVIRQQFCGQYDYVTTCGTCGSQSRTGSDFYELDVNIRGHKTLKDSLESFLQEEKMEGDNKYMCNVCNMKQTATRTIQLRMLPPVLNMQLLRFYFVKNTGLKKKLNSFIEFPETLDMSSYLQQPEGTSVYELTAVLIHRGPTAYSGHYIAHIKDTPSGTWYKFNDEEIEKKQGRNLRLGKEEEIESSENSTKKAPRTSKGTHSSSNAYMLVYTMQGSSTPDDLAATTTTDLESTELPAVVKEYVSMDNQKLEEWVAELMYEREEQMEWKKKHQTEVQDLYTSMSIMQGREDMDWVSRAWLTKWLEKPSEAPPLSVDDVLCLHGRLDPLKVADMKCVSSKTADKLYEKYGGSRRLRGNSSLCAECVRRECLVLRLKKNLEEDDKFIIAALKSNGKSEETGYWVGKASLRSWKRFVMTELEEMQKLVAGETANNASQRRDQLERVNGRSSSEENGARATDRNRNSSDAPRPSSTSPGRATSSTSWEEGEEASTSFRDSSPEGRSNHADQNGDLDSSPSKQDTEDNPDASANQSEMDGSLSPCDSSETSQDDVNLRFNEDLLCKAHGGLVPDLSLRRLVPESVWSRLVAYFPSCPTFGSEDPPCQNCQTLREQADEERNYNKRVAAMQKAALASLLQDRNRPSLLSSPQHVISAAWLAEWRKFVRDPMRRNPLTELVNSTLLCQHGKLLYPPTLESSEDIDDCEAVLVSEMEWKELTQRFTCDVEVVAMATQGEDNSVEIVTQPETCQSCLQEWKQQRERDRYCYKGATIYVRKQPKPMPNDSPSQDTDAKTDPDFRQEAVVKKVAEGEGPPVKVPRMDGGGVRKSQRHRRVRGEKEITVASTQTLKQLKIQIMQQFSVPPFDQTLILDGKELRDDSATLCDLKIEPGAILVLKADEPVEDAEMMEELMKGHMLPEAGFKGTNLLSC